MGCRVCAQRNRRLHPFGHGGRRPRADRVFSTSLEPAPGSICILLQPSRFFAPISTGMPMLIFWRCAVASFQTAFSISGRRSHDAAPQTETHIRVSVADRDKRNVQLARGFSLCPIIDRDSGLILLSLTRSPQQPQNDMRVSAEVRAAYCHFDQTLSFTQAFREGRSTPVSGPAGRWPARPVGAKS
jgi:hypothetical protein